MLQFILLFAVMVFLSAISINGFYNITRGDWYTNPSGTKYWDGKIFSWYSKFWQTHTIGVEYYQSDELLKQYAKIKDFFSNRTNDIQVFFADGILVNTMEIKKAALFYSHCLAHGVLASLQKSEKDEKVQVLKFYKEVKVYKYPNWLRAPFGECITCMSSVFGTGCFIFWYVVAGQVQSLYSTGAGQALIELPILSKVFLWAAFCISLAWANEFIFNVNHKLKQQ